MKALFLVICLFSAPVMASETVEGAKKDLQEFKSEMGERIDAIQKQIDELRSKTKKKGKEAREQTVKGLEKTEKDLQTELDRMKADSGKKFAKVKIRFAEAVDSLNEKIQKALKDE